MWLTRKWNTLIHYFSLKATIFAYCNLPQKQKREISDKKVHEQYVFQAYSDFVCYGGL